MAVPMARPTAMPIPMPRGEVVEHGQSERRAEADAEGRSEREAGARLAFGLLFWLALAHDVEMKARCRSTHPP